MLLMHRTTLIQLPICRHTILLKLILVAEFNEICMVDLKWANEQDSWLCHEPMQILAIRSCLGTENDVFLFELCLALFDLFPFPYLLRILFPLFCSTEKVDVLGFLSNFWLFDYK